MDKRSRILIVDDEPVVRQTLALALDDGSFDVAAVDSAEAGLERFVPGEWDAVLLDKNLPGINGVEFARRLREQDSAVALLMVTGYATADTALETLHIGIDGYLEKPFEDIFEVVRLVQAAVAKKRARHDDSASGAIDHFKKATERLQALSRERGGPRSLLVLLALANDDEATWLGRRFTADDTVERLTDAEVLLERVRERAPDLLVLDSDLCGADLFELVADLRGQAPETTCILVSNRPPLSVVTRLIELDVRAVFERPFDAELFDARIGALLTRLRLQARSAGPFTEPAA